MVRNVWENCLENWYFNIKSAKVNPYERSVLFNFPTREYPIILPQIFSLKTHKNSNKINPASPGKTTRRLLFLPMQNTPKVIYNWHVFFLISGSTRGLLRRCLWKKRQHNELWLFWRQRTARDFFNGLILNFASPLFS